MSYTPGTPDPNEPPDPWATPSGDSQQQPPYPPQPPYGQPYPPQPGSGQPGYGPQFGYPPPYPAPQPTNGKAQAAAWTGVGMLVLSFCCGLGILGFIPIILGVKGRGEIRASGGQQDGEGLATAGIVLGIVAIVLSLLVIVALVVLIAQAGVEYDGYTQTRA